VLKWLVLFSENKFSGVLSLASLFTVAATKQESCLRGFYQSHNIFLVMLWNYEFVHMSDRISFTTTDPAEQQK